MTALTTHGHGESGEPDRLRRQQGAVRRTPAERVRAAHGRRESRNQEWQCAEDHPAESTPPLGSPIGEGEREPKAMEDKTDKLDPAVNDADVQAIIDQGEAGIADLITAYEPIERHYFTAVQVNAPSVTNSIDTTPR